MTAWWLVVLGVATGRLVRLFVNDTILQRFRDWSTHRLPHWLSYGLTCPWCLSGWVSLVAVLVNWSRIEHPARDLVVLWLAVWWAACAAYWVLEYLAHYATKDEVREAVDIGQAWRDVEENG